MKKKRKYRIITAILMSICLSISAPVSHLRQESKAVVAEAVVIGGASIALMALAAFGVSYLIQGASAQETKDYIDTKIIEFKQYSGNNNFPGENPNDYKISPAGKIILGLNAAKVLKDFVVWLNGSSSSVQQEVVYKGGYYDLGNGFKVYQVNQYYSGLSDNRISPYVNAEYLTREKLIEIFPNGGSNYLPSGQEVQFVIDSQPYSDYATFYTKTRKSNHSAQRVYSAPGVSNYWVEILPCITLDNYIFMDGSRTNGEYYAYRYADTIQDLSVIVGNDNINSIEKKGNNEMNLPDLPEVGEGDEGIEFENPDDAPVTTTDPNNVPVPLPASNIFNNIYNTIEGNTENITNYNPTYNIINNYTQQPDINTDDYDEPLPEPEPEPEPDLGTVQQAAGIVSDAIEWFLNLFPWDQMKVKFPFSIPYDLYLIASAFTSQSYNVLGGLPESGISESDQVPVYNMNIPFMKNQTTTVTLDFSMIEPIQPVIRAGAGILFTIALLFFI